MRAKPILMLLLLAVTSICILTCTLSCSRSEKINADDEEFISKPFPIALTISRNDDTQGTKAVKSKWEVGDIVWIFFKQIESKYLELTFSSSGWVAEGKNGLTIDDLGSSGKMTALHFPFPGNAQINYQDDKFTFTNTPYCYYLFDVNISYTVEGGKLTGRLTLSLPDGFVQFFIPDPSHVVNNCTLRQEHIIPIGVAAVEIDGAISVTSDKLAGDLLNGYGFGVGEDFGYIFSGILTSDAMNQSKDYWFTLSASSGQSKNYALQRENKTLTSRKAIKLPTLDQWAEIVSGVNIDVSGGAVRTSASDPNDHIISLMTFNIRHGQGMDSNLDLGRIAGVIADVEPDYVAMQEVDYKTTRSSKIDQANEIARLTAKGYHDYFGGLLNYQGGKYGNAILSKKAPIASTTISIAGSEEPRCVVIAEFSDCYIASTHMSLTAADRLTSCNQINSIASEILNGTYREGGVAIFSGEKKLFILMGDLNTQPNTVDIHTLEKSFHWISKSNFNTFPSNNPNRIIDFILIYKNAPLYSLLDGISKGEKTFATWVQPNAIASDHRPVITHIINENNLIIENP